MKKISKYKKKGDYSYALGVTVVIELLQRKPDVVKEILISSNISIDLKEELEKRAKNISVNINNKLIRYLSPKENCYAIAIFDKYNNNLDDNENHLVLVNPSNGGNLGTIIRSSLGFGIKNIAIIRPGVDMFNPKCIRASMGAIFGVNIEYFDTFTIYQDKYKNRELFPFVLKGKKVLQEIGKINKKYSLIFGNEGAGLSDDFLEIGTPILIRHSADIDSLNLQTAVSIALYEFIK